MSRKVRKKIEHELLEALKGRCRFGENKHLLKQQERVLSVQEERPYEQIQGIFSYTTLQAYQRVARAFSAFASENGAHNAAEAMAFIDKYIETRLSRSLSAWTIHLDAAALACAYGNRIHEVVSVQLPKRERKNITRSLYPTQTDALHDEKRELLRRFTQATGARRIGLTRLRKEDLIERDGKLFVHLREKNGMERDAPVMPDDYVFVKQVFSSSPGYPVNTKRGVEYRLFHDKFVPSNFDNHEERSRYAVRLYDYYARTGQYASGTLYRLRKERYGKVLDRGIMRAVSEALGHHRPDVTTFYIR